jgi:hypothetical protein
MLSQRDHSTLLSSHISYTAPRACSQGKQMPTAPSCSFKCRRKNSSHDHKERCEASGELLTSTLMDYTLPTAQQIPGFVTDTVETPSPRNPLGAKGVGEAGCIAAPPAIVNAVLDALAPLGITTIDMPLKPEKVWALVQAARLGRLEQPSLAPPPAFASGGE